MSNRDGEKNKPLPDGILSSLENAQIDIRKNFEKAAQQIGDRIGRGQNEIVESFTHSHISAQYVASISPALARQYIEGREIVLARTEAKKSLTDLNDLSASQKQAAQTYQKLHSDLPSQIPFYNKEILSRDLERDIVRRAKQEIIKDETQTKSSSPLRSTARGIVVSSSTSKAKEADFLINIEKSEKPQVEKTELEKRPGQKSAAIVKNLPGNALISALESRSPGRVSEVERAVELDKTKSADKVAKFINVPVVTKFQSDFSVEFTSRQKTEYSEKSVDIAQAPQASLESVKFNSKANTLDEVAHIVGAKLADVGIIDSESAGKLPGNQSNTFHSSNPSGIFSVKEAWHTSDSVKNQIADNIVVKDRGEPKLKPNFVTEPSEKISLPTVAAAPVVGQFRLISVSQSKIAKASQGGFIKVAPALNAAKFYGTIKIPPALRAMGKAFVDDSARSNILSLPSAWLRVKSQATVPLTVKLQSEQVLESEIRQDVSGEKNNSGGKTALDKSAGSKHKFESEMTKPGRPLMNTSLAEVQIQHSLNLVDTSSGAVEDTNGKTSRSEIITENRTEDSPPNPKSGFKDQSRDGSDAGSKTDSKTDSKDEPGDIEKHVVKPLEQLPADRQERSLEVLSTKAKDFKFSCSDKNQKYLSGPEIVFAAIIALAGTARLRTDSLASIESIDSIAIVETYSAAAEFQIMEEVSKEEKATADHSMLLPEQAHFNYSQRKRNPVIRPKILIGANDTLVSIAEQLFNDHGLAWLILEINTNISTVAVEGKTVARLICRQEIFIPVYQDIVEFQRLRTKELNANNLITIVEENQIDREILNSTMAVFSGQSANSDPLQKLDEGERFDELHELQIVSHENSRSGDS